MQIMLLIIPQLIINKNQQRQNNDQIDSNY